MRFRRDEQFSPGVGITTAWGFDLPTGKQVLVLLYPLANQHASKIAEGCTHEFTAFEVSDTAKLDLNHSLFDQQSASPLVPGLSGFQFESESDDLAVSRLADVASDLAAGILNPFDDECWAVRFRDGVRVDMESLARGLDLEPEPESEVAA